MGTSTRSASSLPWPASWYCHHHPLKAVCLMSEEVVHNRTLVALGEGGEGATLPLLQLVEDGLGAWRTLLCGLDVCTRCHACLTLDVRDGEGQCSGSRKTSEGKIGIAASLLAAEDLRHNCCTTCSSNSDRPLDVHSQYCLFGVKPSF